MKNVRQHFVPASYLWSFSSEPERKRQAPLHVIDGAKTFSTAVNNLCVERDYYTAEERAREKETHDEVDGDIAEMVRALLQPEVRIGTLRFFMSHACWLYTRGNSFRNEGDLSRLDASQRLGAVFTLAHVLDIEDAESKPKEEVFPMASQAIRSDWTSV